MAQRDDVHEAARGRWRAILLEAGLTAEHLSGKHGPCPLCGGTDRFRWDNKAGSGSSYCNGCGAKSGVDLVMAIRNLNFAAAKRWILEQIGKAPVETPRATRGSEETLRRLSKLWCEANALNGNDPASRYLRSRGLLLDPMPKMIRWHSRVPYRHDDGTRTYHPAMISKFVSADAMRWTLHTTFLDHEGNKADLPTCRKLAPVSVPIGGAVRLASSAETMGIAEGVETALSAAQLHEVPVWASLSAGLMAKWEPPETAKCVLVFGDSDAGFAGHEAAYILAKRLHRDGYHVEVRMPPDLDTDWNDLLVAGKE